MFILKRLIRVAVPYYIILLFVIFDHYLIGWIKYFFENLTFYNVLYSFLFIFESNNGESFKLPFYRIGWTLNFEIFFYVLFTSAMIISHRHRLALTAGVIITLTILQQLFHFDSGTWYMMQTRTSIEFIYGMIIAYLFLNHPAAMARCRVVIPVAFAVIVVAITLLAFGPNVSAFNGTRFITVGIPAALLTCGIVALDVMGRIPKIKFLFYLGGASYSIYLVHFIVIKGIMTIISPDEWPNIIFTISAMTLTSIAVALLFHHLFERPLLQASRLIWKGK
jgi:peptidoglycan/LPS O-acetylase OafA/YrhL